MEEKKIVISENTLLFLLDKIEESYKSECEKIVNKLLEQSK